jgi:hypothetical protein
MPAKPAASAVFVHGLAKKPPLDKLKEIWLWGLSRHDPRPDVFRPPNQGIDISVFEPFFNYYADVYYGEDYETEFGSYYEAVGGVRVDMKAEEEIKAEALDRIEPELPLPKGITPRERRFIRNVEAKLATNPGMLAPKPKKKDELEIAAWLPNPWKQAIIKKAAMEAYYFLFNKEYVRKDGARFMVRQELRKRLLSELDAAAAKSGKIVLVTHSMGTMVAYDVLRNCPECPPVDTLITLGSPLGITEVQDELIAEGEDEIDFPAAKLKRWINVYDPLDPVCGADPKIANDFKMVKGKKIVDVKESNWGNWRHTITHYFAGKLFRKHLLQAIS